ncbi:MAG TPA: 16S rRNA (cytidine(1402)-2'-O)-methyltransferase [Ignavibacteriaceae bacterium]|jgi:16S rRNA (cytidine1402-2'-O)-methyltransferase|nr:MAG: Ribosomal RNA small subunit methyltransferase I [Ignavibacteria bacterium ADurb.Bin266]OQY74169.1 MAG: 16S rRNA (cytidine(1402)-2'-O)-methyltransferase [Ignavibacteriales bacterium UTCHB2]HQF41349.1 16S rRNA (cytidine(1402)-2'-O)-methyltransferase [Ignavibacteriaceae bacterium]HQI39865.1 16S rRNA (cytidine(1402)-2'-O)-methyltransferase [Ignavibacteriaceae bacterium]HQJ46808.1 16S rRNA (cytidine(1402)-2'-O)-methyltransferase [Ignavibacteriaceae bacterium]
MKPKLYIVSTPIGNYEDITLRALRILKECDFIICEEFKEARRLLANYKIQKELFSLNEHTENEAANDLILKLLEGKSAALISDCGTPLFSDPGHLLVDLAIQNRIDVIPIPGVSSLLTALVGSGLNFEKFYYYGWLSPKKDIRRKQLLDLKKRKETIVLMDTPYRLKSLMEDIVKILGSNIPCVLAFELTKEKEKFYRGNTGNIFKIVEKENLKGEFVLILRNK